MKKVLNNRLASQNRLRTYQENKNSGRTEVRRGGRRKMKTQRKNYKKKRRTLRLNYIKNDYRKSRKRNRKKRTKRRR